MVSCGNGWVGASCPVQHMKVWGLMAHSHCAEPGPGMMSLYITPFTVHTTQGRKENSKFFRKFFPCFSFTSNGINAQNTIHVIETNKT